ncbi:MAG: hypothetical protein AB7G08_33385 [Hyphomicrobiaceae bacterium]
MYKNPAIKIALFYVILFLAAIGAIFATGLKPSEAQEASTVGNSITVSVDTVEEDHATPFRFCLTRDESDDEQCFTLKDGDPARVFADLDDDIYELAWDVRSGWRIDSFRCDPRSRDSLSIDEGTARMVLDGDGDHFVCKYVFERVPTSTPTQTATPVPTSTAVPAPTQPPPTILVACPGTTTLVNLANGQTCPTSQPAPPAPTTAPVVQQSSTIKPPATGSAGLLAK